MGQFSRKALSVVLSGLLATSMFSALPARAGATEELEPAPMQQEEQPSGNASQAFQGTAQMGEDTAQSDELAAQSDGVDAQSEVVRPDFDLRSQGVVTPVKKQDPWCTCWSFAGTAAAESSILTLLKERGQTVDPKDFDLSEKHLAWFGTNPITAAIDSKQAGEGMYVTNSEDTPNITWDNGAYGVNVATLYASGAGPTYEKYFPYQGKEALTERQYLIKHPDVGRATARQTGEEQMGMTLEQAVGQPQNERVQPLLTSLRTNGYLTVEDSDLTVPLLEDALYRYYLEKLVTKNCYTSLDDWTIPETTTVDGQESLSRNVTSEFTLVDGNRLPPLSNRNAEDEWVSINQAGIDAVKSELKKGRGVTVAFKADTASPGEVSENPMMNEDTWAHYSGVDMMTNHQVCIVGWCDSYPASNFLEGKQPPANGAWLVKNSWGSEYDYTTLEDGETINYGKWGMKDESGKQTGYFWLSYYDKTSRNCQSYSFDTDLAEADGQLRVQMYDYMPSTVDAHNVEDTIEQSEGVVKTANVFKNDSDEYVKLASVSTKTASTNATVKYSVYRLRDGSQNPEDGELLGTKTATYEYAGFHRERLDGSIVIKPGETFSVVAEETVESGGKTLHEYATNVTYSKAHAEDVKAKEAQAGTPKNQRDRIADEYGVAVVNKGESFIFDGGKWTDWSEYEPRTSISEQYAIDNFSIKAYLVSTSEPKTFPDVKQDDWFYESVMRATDLGLFSGYSDGNFGPNDKITRGQVAVVLWNMTGRPPIDEGTTQFPDVEAGTYYADAVAWARTKGVVSGYKDGRFGPNDPVTREQLAAMLANYAREVAGIEVSGSADDYEGMKDAGSVSPWAVSSVGWCFGSEIMSGTEDGYVNPQGNATRAEAATVLVSMHDRLQQ